MKALPIVTFVFGAAAGAFASWQLLKRYYAEKTEAEIASVKEAFGRAPIQKEEEPHTANNYTNPVESITYIQKKSAVEIMKERGYVPDIPDIPKNDSPYVISPEMFEEEQDYYKVYLNYYADGVVADTDNNMLTHDEIEQSIGFDCLGHFGEYEPDAVHVRNDVKNCDYEITKDLQNYTELSPAEFL